MSLYGDEDEIIKEKESQVAGWSQVKYVAKLLAGHSWAKSGPVTGEPRWSWSPMSHVRAVHRG
jgi:hypothetical protein